MADIKLLDCTLRDGGYVNDWKFGHNNLVSIFERVVDAGVDFIEVGFLDDSREFDIDRSIMPDTDSMEKLYGGLERKDTMVVGMIDYGTCDLSNIKPCSESFLDAIRVIFKKSLRKDALAYCAELKKRGYKVFAQLVSVTSYSEDEMMDLIHLANEVKPYAVSMVDTYGLMHQNNLRYYFELLNCNLEMEIGIGYHGHNNFQMAYANCIEMISQKTDRMLLVDGTLYGMGKSAGNAPIELIAMYLNDRYDKHYHISQFLEAIDVNIMELIQPSTWGYNLFFYLAASNDCHPSYVSYLMNKRTLSMKSVNELLERLEGEKKLLYSKDYIEKLYLMYQNNEVNDTEDRNRLAQSLCGKKILLLGPGKNVELQKERIKKYISKENPIIISINFISDDFKPNFVFLSNAKRYVQLATELSQKKQKFEVIATSNVTKTNGNFDYTLNYSTLIDENEEVIDNPLLMLLEVIFSFDVSQVFLGGFDGYAPRKKYHYVDYNMEYHFDKEQAERINEHVKQKLKSSANYSKIQFLTESLYSE